VNLIYIGTSGFSYEDWKGNFYPSGIVSKDYLCYYSTLFNTVEINFTYYCFPNISTFFGMCEKTKDAKDFVFSIKANKIFTHQRDYNISDVKSFTDTLLPLKDNGRLGSILFQFPYSFRYCNENMEYLAAIGKNFSGFDICAEFRNIYWLKEKVLKLMHDYNIGFCNVDEPPLAGLLPQSDICTTETGYIRFHGRNSASWWQNENAYQRYDYMYKKEELSEWVQCVKNITEKSNKTYIYFNNHYKGKAAKSALMFLDILKSENIYTSQI
jgi:uncharacterized protein YecE (DUF72 family)